MGCELHEAPRLCICKFWCQGQMHRIPGVREFRTVPEQRNSRRNRGFILVRPRILAQCKDALNEAIGRPESMKRWCTFSAGFSLALSPSIFTSSFLVESAHSVLRLALVGDKICQGLLSFLKDSLSDGFTPWLNADFEGLRTHVQTVAVSVSYQSFNYES